jgi:hypothetical protein
MSPFGASNPPPLSHNLRLNHALDGGRRHSLCLAATARAPESVRVNRSSLDSGARARSNEGSVKLNEVVSHRAFAQFW